MSENKKVAICIAVLLILLCIIGAYFLSNSDTIYWDTLNRLMK